MDSLSNKITRRQMLRIIAGIGIAGLAGYKLGFDHGLITSSETRLLIGTIVNLTVVATDAEAGRRAITACFDRMSVLESSLSRFIPESDLSRLNRDSHLENANTDLLEVLRQAQQISQLSEGAFDVTILPVLTLYQDYASRGWGLPPEDLVQQARTLVGFERIKVEENSVSFTGPGIQVTLDGIAKGYIIDSAATVLRQLGFSDVLVKAGGDLMALGKNEEGEPWRIGIQSPRQEQGVVIARFGIENRAAATSGDYLQPFAADYSEYHILNPHLGHSSHELSSATVVAPTAMLADALATAVMVMGPERWQQLIHTIPGCSAYVVTKQQEIRVLT